MREKTPNPYSKSDIVELLKEHGFRFGKKFGQNLLLDPKIAERIVDFSGIRGNLCVLEIGTGFMGLTLVLSRDAKTVFSMEVDRRIINLLEEEFSVPKNVTLIPGDALSFDYEHFSSKTGKKIDLVANLPFNISSQVLLKLFENAKTIDSATLSFQKELAQRITSPPGRKSYGTLSVLASLFAKCEWGFSIPPEAFFPKPSVDTSIIKMMFRKDLPLKEVCLFSRFLQKAFAYRRKTLLNTLSNMEKTPSKEEIAAMLMKGGFEPGSRLEDLEPLRILDLFKLFTVQSLD